MVNVNDLVDIVNSAYSGALAGLYLCAVFLECKRFVQYLVYKARFAAAGNTGDAGYNALGDIYINVFKVVLGSAAYVYKALIGLAALGRNRDFRFPLRYCPVSESGQAQISSTVPAATTLPP